MVTGFITVVGIVAGILTAISMLPQLIKTFKEKKAEDISLVMILVLMSGIACWIWYGFLRNDLPIILSNCFSFLINAMLLILHFKYEENKK
ncbi:MAG: SemiSWEET transporter [Bacteroidota bacterium]|nr:SemiSWEET transporter [Bacteroidota bacterium]